MSVAIINPLHLAGWDDSVLSLPGCSFFHSSAWAQVLSEAYSYRPAYFTIFDGDRMTACLPMMEIDSILTGKRGVSLPFTDIVEPLVSSAHQFQDLFTAAREYGREQGWKSIELRGGSGFLGDAAPSSAYLTHTLDLAPKPISQSASQPISRSSQSAPLFSALRDSTRRNIRKASDSGVSVEIGTTEQALRAFYRLNQGTRREHGLPPQPWRFFQALHEHVLSQGCGFVAAASFEGTVIAASVYIHFGRTAIYKYGASDKGYQHLRANNLVMWEAIRWFAYNGFASLSFGRTDIGHDGLRQFKAGWGAVEGPISYYRYSLGAGRFVTNGRHATNGVSNRILAVTPLPVLRALGSVLYKHMG